MHITSSSLAQVTIGTGLEPDKDALLDLKENEEGFSLKGLLLPRVALVSTDLPDPMSEFVRGMVVYNTASSDAMRKENSVRPGFYYCDGSKWIRLVPTEEVVIPNEPWKVAGTGENATLNTQNIYQNGQVLVGRAGTPDPTAQFEVNSGSRGMLMPRLSKKQRDGITNPTESLLIWNTDEGCFNFWKNSRWRSMCGGMGDAEIQINPIDCSEAVVVGDYKVGVPTQGGNYIELTLQVIEPGSYVIGGEPGRGFFFQRSGSFASAGTYTIQIPAVGTPNEPGIFDFPLLLNGVEFNPSCLKQVEVDPADAKFTFDPSYCGIKTYSDDLIKGESSSGKKIQVKVNIETAGKFNFYTNTVNGVQYTANNVNLAAGSRVVTLYANGNAPTESGQSVVYTVTGTGLAANAATCEVLVDILTNEAELAFSCDNVEVFGTYLTEVETTGDNYIELQVTVGEPGEWSATATNLNAGIIFEGSGIFAPGTKGTTAKVRLYASGTSSENPGIYPFDIVINGNSCSVDVRVYMPQRNILVIGGASSSIVNAIRNTANFGPNGTSMVYNMNVIEGTSNPDAAALMNYINNNDIEVIVSGWSFDRDNDATSVIADFIRNKKGFFLYAQGQSQETNLSSILSKAYGMNVSLTGLYYRDIRSAKLPTLDIPILNGVFGDVRGKYVRSDDTGSWNGIVPGTEGDMQALIEVPANGSGTGSNAARLLFNYNDSFFYFPDWGTLNYTGTSYGGNAPISFSVSNYSSHYSWDGTDVVSSFVLPAGESAGWVLFGNVLDNALKYVQKNIVKGYKVDTNYSN